MLIRTFLDGIVFLPLIHKSPFPSPFWPSDLILDTILIQDLSGTGIQQAVNRGIAVYIPDQDRQPFPYLLVVLYNPVIDMLFVLDQADIVKEDQVGLAESERTGIVYSVNLVLIALIVAATGNVDAP